MEILKYILPAVAIYAIIKPSNTPPPENGKAAKIGEIDIEDEVTEYVKPFDIYKVKPQNGKAGKFADELQDAKKRAGVYAILENSKIVYIGHSRTQLYKTITRHFHEWRHEGRQVTYDPNAARYRVAIFYTRPEVASLLECYYIDSQSPRDNYEKCEGGFFSYEDFLQMEEDNRRRDEEVPF